MPRLSLARRVFAVADATLMGELLVAVEGRLG
jgi:hypothetical protein